MGVPREADGAFRLGIVGGGIAGLACARRAAEGGLRVTVFDRGRGPAGRASTRREGIRGREIPFDHGAQYFTVRDPRFSAQVAEWTEAGTVARWEGRVVAMDGRRDPGGTRRYVGVPGMSALGRWLARGLDVRWGHRVEAVVPSAGGGRRSAPFARGPGRVCLRMAGEDERPAFDAVVVAVPAPQAVRLLQDAAPSLARVAEGHDMRPCWAVMAAFRERLPVAFDGAFFTGSPVSWAARNSSKPHRPVTPDAWVIHGAPGWSEANLGLAREAVEAELLGAFLSAIEATEASPVFRRAHRWGCARSVDPRDDGCLVGAGGRILLAGDWLAGDRIEGAYLSGWSAAERVLPLR